VDKSGHLVKHPSWQLVTMSPHQPSAINALDVSTQTHFQALHPNQSAMERHKSDNSSGAEVDK